MSEPTVYEKNFSVSVTATVRGSYPLTLVTQEKIEELVSGALRRQLQGAAVLGAIPTVEFEGAPLPKVERVDCEVREQARSRPSLPRAATWDDMEEWHAEQHKPKQQNQVPCRVVYDEREDPHKRCKYIADVPSLQELEAEPPAALIVTTEGGRLSTESVRDLESLVQQCEGLARQLRGAGIIIGALLRRLKVDAITLTAAELVEGPGAHEVEVTDYPVEGGKTIRIKRGG